MRYPFENYVPEMGQCLTPRLFGLTEYGVKVYIIRTSAEFGRIMRRDVRRTAAAWFLLHQEGDK